ncbi:ankyrin-2-like isoform X1 [Hordeum vulgare subsp. vulgare]|uniref:ankyrin-2-like isoform X1 n=1 Tax=Hordeum vulgare subsp. vulgare TaxID=112509 RepID=UPI001D1A58D7|nr:ankyrin-2-like isoform X1 [Hordeum vulgare subsp. vulgare]
MASSPSSIDAALKKPAKKVGLRRAKAADVETMLHFASRQCCLVSCRFLVEGAGLDVNSESKTGVTPIFLAALQGNVQITRDHVGDPAMPDEKVSMPLYNAAVAGHCESVRLLLSKGRHVDPICYRGTLLHLAAVKDHDQVVMVLLEHGADPNKAAHHVFSRLVMTYCGKSLKCMRLLIEAGADVSARKCSGPIPLMEAVDDGLTDFAKVLPDGGANLNISNQIGNAGLDVPRAAGQTMKAIVELLRVFTMYLLLVFLLAILLLSTGVHSITHDTSFSEGTCRYDMISVAVLSCMQPDKSWKSPSVSCCKALIYAIDELPASGENGKCCLCRFMRAKLHYPELAATYISCQGKDRAIVAKWSFPVVVCGKACSRKEIAPPRKETVMERPPSNSHGSKILFILFAAVFVILLIFILYLWWVRQAAQGRRESLPLMQIQKQARSSPGSGGRRQSSGRLKERRPSGQ